jgi:hypothetical protein
MQTAQSTTKAEQQEPTGDAKIPQKEVLSSARRHFLEAVSEVLPSYRPFCKQANLGQLLTGMQRASGVKLQQAASRLPYALGGAAVGAGVGAAGALTSNDPLRSKVRNIEALPDRTLGQSMDLAQARARLAVAEWEERHPLAAIGAGAMSGGLMGFSSGPEIIGAAGSIPKSIHNIVSNVRQYKRRI